MSDNSMLDVHESPDQRMQRRRARRWKRRARIAGPFLGVPLLLGTLVLSIDLIEYQPQKPKPRLADRPMPEAVIAKQRARSVPLPSAISSNSVVTSRAQRGEALAGLAPNDASLDVTLGDEDRTGPGRRSTGTREPSGPMPPMPPYTLRDGR